MAPTTGPLLVAAVLLVLAGAPKVVDPALAVGALRSVGARVPPVAVRAMGAVEAALGLATLLIGGRVLAGLVAASYAGFTAFLVVALRRGGAVSSCGCVGREDTPPTVSHVVVTAGLTVAAALAAGLGADGLTDLEWNVNAAALLAFTGFAIWLCWLIFTALPRLSMKDV